MKSCCANGHEGLADCCNVVIQGPLLDRLVDDRDRFFAALEALAEWSVPLDEPDPENPQTEYGQMKKFAREALRGQAQ